MIEKKKRFFALFRAAAIVASVFLSGGGVKAFSFPAMRRPMLKVRLKEGSFLPAALLPRGTES